MVRKNSNGDVEQTQPPKKSNKNEEQWGGFIDIRMTDSDKTSFSEWLALEGDDWWSEIEESLLSGLKVGVTYDNQNQCYIATLTGSSGSLAGFRYALSARSSTWTKALSLLIYKHAVMLRRNWGNFRPASFGVEID